MCNKLKGKEAACQCRKHRINPWVRKFPWRWKWQPTPLFLPGKTHGQRSLWGYNPWDHKRVGHNLEARRQQQKNITCDTVYDRQVSINNGQINYGIWTSLKIISVNPKGNQPWIFIGKTDAEAESPILWPPDAKSRLIGKDPDAGKDWGQKEKGVPEAEMVGWHPWLNGHEFRQTQLDNEEQEAWRHAVHEITKSRTWLSNLTTSYNNSDRGNF